MSALRNAPASYQGELHFLLQTLEQEKHIPMTDIVYLGVTVGFFLLCVLYAMGCEKV